MAGGVRGYPVERVRQEVAYLGRHVHWTLADALTLEHAERLEWIRQIAAAREAEGTA